MKCEKSFPISHWLALVLAISAFSSLSHAQDPVWQDDFDGNSLDTSKWNIITGYLNVNAELENYQAENVALDGEGNLVITAMKQQMGDQGYTSGRIDTSGKHSFTYGCAQARIQIPLGAGLWPAFWMLGQNINEVGWPKCGEIDIMEHVNDDNVNHGTLHWSNNNQQADYGTQTTIDDPGNWHIYSTNWTPAQVTISVDGRQFFVMDTNAIDAFQKPFYLLLNLAVGGNFPQKAPDDSKLPAVMKVDWVKVYSDNCPS